jgi:hypothetical protein
MSKSWLDRQIEKLPPEKQKKVHQLSKKIIKNNKDKK